MHTCMLHTNFVLLSLVNNNIQFNSMFYSDIEEKSGSISERGKLREKKQKLVIF